MRMSLTPTVRLALSILAGLVVMYFFATKAAAQPLQVSIPGNHAVCVGGSITLNPQVSGGMPPYMYTWTPATGLSCTNCPNPVASPTQPTTYSLNVRDQAGAQANAITVVLVGAQPTISVSPASFTGCTGGAIVLTASVNGGSGSCNIQWQTSLSAIDGWATISGASGVTYNAPFALGTRFYRATYTCTGGGCNVAVSDAAAVTGSLNPGISVSPANSAACVGNGLTLTATLENSVGACLIQWQSSPTGTGNWTTISGANGPTYTAPNTIAGTWYYRALYTCSGTFCNIAVSNVALVDVVVQPAVQISPVESFVCRNDTLTLRATGTGNSSNCTLQWLSSPNAKGPWTPIPDATGAAYQPPTDALGTMYYAVRYECSGSSCGGTVNGQSVKVVTLTQPTIQLTATDSVVCVGGSALLTAQVDNGSPECALQWQRADSLGAPWINIPQANQPTYQVPAGSPDTSFYRVVYACPSASSAQSNSLTLTIGNALNALPGQQICLNISTTNFTNMLSLQFSLSYDTTMLQFVSVGQFGLSNLSLNTNFGLPPSPGNSGQRPAGSLSFLWLAPNINLPVTLPDGAVLFSICFNVLSNVNDTEVSFSNWPTVMEAVRQPGIIIPFNGVSGTVSAGQFCRETVSSPIRIAINPAPTIRIHPENQIVCTESLVTLTAQVNGGAGACSIQWYSAPSEQGPWALVPGADSAAYQPPADQLGLYHFQARLTCTGSQCAAAVSSPATVLVTNELFTEALRVAPVSCNVWQLSPIVPPTYFGQINILWTLPDGSTSTAFQLLATQTGVYQLQISTPGAPCVSYIAQYINADADECAGIKGKVVLDANANCQAEASETGLANWVVRATGAAGVFHSITDPVGQYAFSLPLGAYQISVLPPASSWQLCAAAYPVTLSQPGQNVELNIPVRQLRPCPQLEVQLSTPLLRRCFISTYIARVCNVGTEPAHNPTVKLALDNFLTYQGAQLPPAAIQGQMIFWTLPTLAPGQCRQFSVQVLVSCDAVLEQTHCSTLSATPDSLCAPASSQWSGANLEVSGECAGSQVRFRVRNTGTGHLTTPVPCIVIEDVVMLMHQPGSIPELASGSEQTFDFPANGATYIFSVGQAPHHPHSSTVTAALEGCGTNSFGTFSTGFVNQLPLSPPTPASHTLCQPNIGAYDPNDKQAVPVGYGPEHYIRPGDALHYQIRFQNTGTDTAFTVVIRDTLSPWLDVATLRLGPASHPYLAGFDGERTLVFTFNNILLPDSATNLEASQGFVDFFIRTRDSIPLQTRIENSAAIYFDFNEPVITNTVFHTIGRDFIPTATAVFQPQLGYGWQLFPNPATDAAWLISEQPIPGRKTARLYDAIGRPLRQIPFEGDRCLLQFQGLAPGWYALQIADAGGRSLGTARIVIR